MKHLKVALSDSVQSKIKSIAGRTCVDIFETDFTDVGAIVIDDGDLDLVNNNQIHIWGIPIIALRFDETSDLSFYKERIASIIDFSSTSLDDCKSEIEKVVVNYESSILPPFFRALSDYVGNETHSSIVQAIKVVSSSINILQVVPFIISLGKIYLEQTFVMQM